MAAVPNAWDDDWAKAADRAGPVPQQQPKQQLSKRQQRAQHAQWNKKIWEEADAPREPMHYIEAPTAGGAPLALTSHPKRIRMLNRQPPANTAPLDATISLARKDGGVALGIEHLHISKANESGDEDEDSSENEESKKKPQMTAEEMRKQKNREMEEKRRRYEEARARIFGDDSNGSAVSTANNSTPNTPAQQSPRNGDAPTMRGRGGRGRGRGRGYDKSRRTDTPAPFGGVGGGKVNNNNSTSSSPAPREAYDGSPWQIQIAKRPIGRGVGEDGRRPTPDRQQQLLQPIREPRIPGKGPGFGQE